jgi:hypothetical protein
MKPEDRYHRFVQWSDEDQCYIGYCPDIFYGGCCHGDLEEEVYAELCGIALGNKANYQLSYWDAAVIAAAKAAGCVEM